MFGHNSGAVSSPGGSWDASRSRGKSEIKTKYSEQPTYSCVSDQQMGFTANVDRLHIIFIFHVFPSNLYQYRDAQLPIKQSAMGLF